MKPEGISQQLDHELWRQNFIREIRERSAKRNSQFRREYADRVIHRERQRVEEGKLFPSELANYGGNPEEFPVNVFLAYYHSHPALGVFTLDDYFAYHAFDDTEMDKHLITSADLLDLHLSELKDFKEFGQGGLYSWRTDRVIDRVVDGLVWGIDYEASHTENPFEHILLPDYKRKLLTAPSALERIIIIHKLLNAIHQWAVTDDEATGALLLIRDLRWICLERREAAREFLDFLSNELL